MSGIHHLELHLPRYAFGPRDAARAGSIWRLMQEAAVLGSGACGWPPSRYRSEGIAFVVREMTVVHHREARYGDQARAQTWVSEFRRGLLTTRQIRVQTNGEPLADAAQEWVHVDMRRGMRPTRASESLQRAFEPVDDGTTASLPTWEACPQAPSWRFGFEAWHTWMDPLDHANHPLYVDWCDEALCRQIAALGGDPRALVPVAERVHWRLGVGAMDAVAVESRLIGQTAEGAAVVSHRLTRPEDGREIATATSIRRLLNQDVMAFLSA